MEFYSASLGEYERAVIPAIRAALLETERVRPADPVEYMANLLFRFARVGGVPDNLTGNDLILPPSTGYSPTVRNLPPIPDPPVEAVRDPSPIEETFSLHEEPEHYHQEPERVGEPEVELSQPNVMTRWVVGRPAPLEFICTGFKESDRLFIRLCESTGLLSDEGMVMFNSVNALAGDGESIRHADGSVTRKLWWTPSTRLRSGNTYFVSIEAAQSQEVHAVSDRFYIQGKSVTVLRPTSRDTWEIGVPQTISWRADNFLPGERVTVRLVHPGPVNSSSVVIFDNVEPFQHPEDPTSTVTWTPPDTVSTSWDCMVVVESALDPSVRSASEPFSIQAPVRKSTILLHTPTPTTSWTAGLDEEIRFTVVDFKPGYRIRFVLRSWQDNHDEMEIATVNGDIPNGNVQSLFFAVPRSITPGRNYFIHAVCVDNPRIRADSVEFEIRGVQPGRSAPNASGYAAAAGVESSTTGRRIAEPEIQYIESPPHRQAPPVPYAHAPREGLEPLLSSSLDRSIPQAFRSRGPGQPTTYNRPQPTGTPGISRDQQQQQQQQQYRGERSSTPPGEQNWRLMAEEEPPAPVRNPIAAPAASTEPRRPSAGETAYHTGTIPGERDIPYRNQAADMTGEYRYSTRPALPASAAARDTIPPGPRAAYVAVGAPSGGRPIVHTSPTIRPSDPPRPVVITSSGRPQPVAYVGHASPPRRISPHGPLPLNLHERPGPAPMRLGAPAPVQQWHAGSRASLPSYVDVD